MFYCLQFSVRFNKHIHHVYKGYPVSINEKLWWVRSSKQFEEYRELGGEREREVISYI